MSRLVEYREYKGLTCHEITTAQAWMHACMWVSRGLALQVAV